MHGRLALPPGAADVVNAHADMMESALIDAEIAKQLIAGIQSAVSKLSVRQSGACAVPAPLTQVCSRLFSTGGALRSKRSFRTRFSGSERS